MSESSRSSHGMIISPLYLHLSWWIMRKVISMIHLFSELAATGISDITNSYAENHISTLFHTINSSKSVCSLSETEEKVWYSISCQSDFILTLQCIMFLSCNKECPKILLQWLGNGCLFKSSACYKFTYIYYIYCFLWFSKYVNTEVYLQEVILMAKLQTKLLLRQLSCINA